MSCHSAVRPAEPMLQGTSDGGRKECAERVLTLTCAVEAAAAHGPPTEHAAATLALCCALRSQRSMLADPPADPRPHLQHLLQLLHDAEAFLLRALPLCAPPDAPPRTTHPAHALHARLLVHLASTHAEHACADLEFAEADLRAKRPAFPTFSCHASRDALEAHREVPVVPEEHVGSVPSRLGSGATLEDSPGEAAGRPGSDSPSARVNNESGPHGPHSPHGQENESCMDDSTCTPLAATESPPVTDETEQAPADPMQPHWPPGTMVPACETREPEGRPAIPAAADLDHSVSTAAKLLAGASVEAVERFLDATEAAALEERGEGAVGDAPHAFHAARHACAALAVCGRGAIAVDARLAHARSRLAELQLAELLTQRRAGEVGPDANAADAVVARSSSVTAGCGTAADDPIGAMGASNSSGAAGDVNAEGGGSSSADHARDNISAAQMQDVLPAEQGNPSLRHVVRAEVLPLLRAALDAAIQLRDWPRGARVVRELLRVLRLVDSLGRGEASGLPESAHAGGAGADTVAAHDQQGPGVAAGALQPAAGEGSGPGDTASDVGDGDAGVTSAVAPEGMRELAEAVVAWRACDALAEDSKALHEWAPLRHTARVSQRVTEWWHRPEDAERHTWCTDLEAAALPHAAAALAPSAANTADEAAAAAPAEGTEASEGQGGARAAVAQQLQALRRSGWVNGRAGGKLCGPLRDCVAALPAGTAAVVLVVEEGPLSGPGAPGDARVHAVCVRPAPAGSGAGEEQERPVDLMHCMGPIDMVRLQALLAQVTEWETSLKEAEEKGVFSAVMDGEPDTVGQEAAPRGGTAGVTEGGAGEEGLHDGSGESAEATGGNTAAEADHASVIVSTWNTMLEQMESLLEPVQPALAAAASEMAAQPPPTPATPAKGGKGGGAAETPPPQRPAIVMCCCPRLAALPLEALAALVEVPALARDRSLHHAAARWQLASQAAAGAPVAAVADVAKAACSMSSELQGVVGSQLEAVARGEWKMDLYRPDWGVSQGYHLMMAKESQGVMHWTCDAYGVHVHCETMANMELRGAKFVSVLDRLTAPPPPPRSEGTPEGAEEVPNGTPAGTPAGNSLAVSAGIPQQRRRTTGEGGSHQALETRMCMMLQRGAACCVGNRWPLAASVGVRVIAAALPPLGTLGVAAGVRGAVRAMAEEQRMPWLPACVVVYGVPGLVLQASSIVDEGLGKKKKK